MKYKHIAVFNDSFQKFKQAKDLYSARKVPRYVTDDDFVNELISLWCQVEAGVLKVVEK